MLTELPALSAYDWIALLVLILSMAVGLLRGVVREVASIAAWLGALLAARQWSEPLAVHFEHSIENGALRLALAFIVVFVVALILIGLIGQWLAQAIRKVGLRPLDRVLGALFGVVRGGLILLVLVLLAAATGVNEQRDWKHAVSTAWMERMAARALPILPPALAQRIHLHAPASAAAVHLKREG
jgi:membrane protein required for colicin V production